MKKSREIVFYEYNPDFCNNRIKTSRYTWWNFVFLNLLEQFRNISNIYFLIALIINLLFEILEF
jgi:hypothetical protein